MTRIFNPGEFETILKQCPDLKILKMDFSLLSDKLAEQAVEALPRLGALHDDHGFLFKLEILTLKAKFILDTAIGDLLSLCPNLKNFTLVCFDELINGDFILQPEIKCLQKVILL